jgi:hypothetical protein
MKGSSTKGDVMKKLIARSLVCVFLLSGTAFAAENHHGRPVRHGHPNGYNKPGSPYYRK